MLFVLAVDLTYIYSYAEDLVVCVALGVDMFDCVFPTRTAVCELCEFFFVYTNLGNRDSVTP